MDTLSGRHFGGLHPRWNDGARAGPTAPAPAEQAENSRRNSGSAQRLDPKHSPKIEAPASVRRGEWFEVTVTRRRRLDAPSLQEHFVRYIALDRTRSRSRASICNRCIGPKVTFTVASRRGGALRAIAEPTHSAAWEASRKITVRP